MNNIFIGIIAANNIRYSPYINFYTRIFDELDVKYELIFPDRSDVEDSFPAACHVLKWNKNFPTALAYFEYTRKAIKVIKEKQYDLLVVLTTNNATFMAQWLKKHYPSKYIVDIRDYTHENIRVYYNLEKLAINNSIINVISSKKFKEFLPSGEYLVCHNIASNEAVCMPSIKHDLPITIGYIGKGNYLDQCRNICERIYDDQRFRISFHGMKAVPEELKRFEQHSNIRFNGIFAPNEKKTIIQNTDIIFNAYGNGTPLLDCALSNKLYDALLLGKPILTSPNTFMSEMAGPFAFDVDFNNPQLMDDLYGWYIGLDEEELFSYSRRKINEIYEDNCNTEAAIRQAIKKN